MRIKQKSVFDQPNDLATGMVDFSQMLINSHLINIPGLEIKPKEHKQYNQQTYCERLERIERN